METLLPTARGRVIQVAEGWSGNKFR